MLGIIICVALLITVLILFVLWKQKASYFSNIQSAPHWPIIGSIFFLEKDPHALFKQLKEFAITHDFLFTVWLLFRPFIIIGKVEFSEFVLSSQEIITKSYLYDFLHPWLGTGLLTSTGLKWKTRRRALTPTFHFTILKEFQQIFINQALVLTTKLKGLVKDGKVFDIQTPISLATLDIICETAMGVSVNAQNESDSDYVNAINVATRELQWRQKNPHLHPDFIYKLTSNGRNFFRNLKILHTFTSKVIADKIQSRKSSGGNKPKVFMDLLLEMYEKNEIDVEGICEEVDTFMFEGHDTTAAGLSWTLYLLGKNLTVQTELHAEIDKVASEDGDLVDKIKGLKYLEYVMKEGLRLHPPVSMFGREVETETKICDTTIPKGTTLLLDVISLHTNPEYWDDPYVFKPERFAEERFLKRNPYCYVPFSAGARNCIGQKFAMLEEKILLYHIMLHFEVRSVQKEEEVKECFEIIHKSGNGLLVKLFSREK